MKIGVLTVGSLYWEADPIREEWRRERLVLDARVRVTVPIRYGRESSTRGFSYTMVLCADLERGDFGQSLVLPCRNPVTRVEHLIEEARRLWAAERKAKVSENVSADWGCVALLPNPARRIAERIVNDWAKHVRNRKGYGNEPVDEHGVLKIPWPEPADGSDLELDALLATSTLANRKRPSIAAIAKGWTTPKGKKHIDYFIQNKANGIVTFQDREIEDCLKRLCGL